MRLIYTSLFYLLIPAILLRLAWRARKAPGYAKRWSERFGFFSPLPCDKKIIWIHTVSVGEFLAALPLIRRLQALPDFALMVTTTTPTGSERVKESLGKSVYHVYAPYDLPDVVARFIKRVNPAVYVVMETELWPNTIAACAARGIPSVLINARMSAKSARGYQRFAALSRSMLTHLTQVAAQSNADAQRLVELGLPSERIAVTGNIKFDLHIDESLRGRAKALKNMLSRNGDRRIWIAASTHAGEDELILSAFARLRRSMNYPLLVLVPRHPERFDTVAALALEENVQVIRRSEQRWSEGTDILLGDTMGELMMLYGASDIAFVGGSLVPRGGHNLIEPAAWRLPIISGPHLFNFSEVSRLLLEASGLDIVQSADELAACVKALMENPAQSEAQGNAAWAVAEANRGALERTLILLKQQMS